MLSNAYFLAKFRFDTAENEPAKNLLNLLMLLVLLTEGGLRRVRRRGLPAAGPLHGRRERAPREADRARARQRRGRELLAMFFLSPD